MTAGQDDNHIAMAEAVRIYLADCIRRKLAESTIISYRGTLDALHGVLPEDQRQRYLDLDLRAFTDFLGSRNTTVNSQRERDRAPPRLLRIYAQATNGSGELRQADRASEGYRRADVAVREEEVQAIIAACDMLGQPSDAARGGERRPADEIEEEERKTARALIFLLLYSGLRISDATQLQRSRLNVATRQAPHARS